MTKLNNEYMVGLDIGTNSCGWVATDFDNNILKMHGKRALGSHLFDEGVSAADRRAFRTTRRRIKRRKWRLKLLEEIFDEEMAKVDPNFFARLKESGLSPLDTRKNVSSIVFPTKKMDKQFYKKFPTIYHLRNALMKQDKKFDLRAIYIAIHHIVKYRGNFLSNSSISNFSASKIEIDRFVNELNDLYSIFLPESGVIFDAGNASKVEDIIRNEQMFKLDKIKEIADVLPDTENKSGLKLSKKISKEISKAILGYKAKFEIILQVNVDKTDSSIWNFKLNDENADVNLSEITSDLTDTQLQILDLIRNLFSAISLLNIVDEGSTLSESMIRKYNDHAQDLKLLKTVIKNHSDRKKAHNLQLAYDKYVNNRHFVDVETKKAFPNKHLYRKSDFYEIVKKNLDASKEAVQIRKEIALDKFMPKQRSDENGVIPFQLNQIELDKIIENQGEYYPFLKEINPIKAHRMQAPYKLDELIRFRVPYYVGPMIEPTNSSYPQTRQNQSFAWMVRKAKGRITPWNFDEKVDRQKSANNFIKRLTTKDTYLFGEDVLPANSLLYQKYTVLDELNKISVNGKKLSVSVKQELYEDLFKKNNTVSAKQLKNWLIENQKLPYIKIKGLADQTKFNSSLSTYIKLKKSGLFVDKLDSNEFRDDFEKIIEWSTIFEDKQIYIQKLQTIDWLTAKQIQFLQNIRLQGWGRLSKKLLTAIVDSNGQNIIEQLWNSQQIFMSIVNKADIKGTITDANQDLMHSNSMEDILSEAYTSPANKKMIRQVVKVVHDIQKAASGQAPKQIAIEFARESRRNSKLSQTRGHKLQDIYQKISGDIVNKNLKDKLAEYIKNNQLNKDKYYLYFMQLGRDAYTGKPINIDEVSQYYDIDHILPQSFIKDDSLNNRVLVAKPINNGKSDGVPLKLFGDNLATGLGITVKQMWNNWADKGLINKAKQNNLFLDPENINKHQASGFIRKQLVETSQIIKLATTILQAEYPKTKIIVVKASSNHYLRNEFDLYKSREVNDYHHAIDAYLTTICGNLLYQAYPKLRPFFVYGQFKKFSSDPKKENEILKKTKNFDFVAKLLGSKAPNEIRSQQGKVLFEKNKIRLQLNKAYNYKYMLVSRDTTTKNQEMFGMTIYPRAERDIAKSRKLIEKRKGFSTDIYGGYTGTAAAYMAIVRINKTKSSQYKVIAVPMTKRAILNKAEKEGNYEKILKQILSPSILYNDKGKPKAGVISFDIIKGKVPYNQVVQDGNKKFLLKSAIYLCNAKQLVLSEEAMRVITGHWLDSDKQDQELLDVYDEVLEKIDRYLPLFDIRDFRNKLHKGREKFLKLNAEDKLKAIIQILKGLHDNSDTGELKDIGITIPFGQLQNNSGITLSSDTILVYQSPTGLFEKRVKISSL